MRSIGSPQGCPLWEGFLNSHEHTTLLYTGINTDTSIIRPSISDYYEFLASHLVAKRSIARLDTPTHK